MTTMTIPMRLSMACPNFEIGCGYYKGLAPGAVSLVRFLLPASSAPNPVVHLDLKYIRGAVAEKCASLRTEIEISWPGDYRARTEHLKEYGYDRR